MVKTMKNGLGLMVVDRGLNDVIWGLSRETDIGYGEGEDWTLSDQSHLLGLTNINFYIIQYSKDTMVRDTQHRGTGETEGEDGGK